jgi:hypothetical protein
VLLAIEEVLAMKYSIQCQLVALAIFAVLLVPSRAAQAQVETIDLNPTMPRDVGGRLTYRGFSGGGARLGRSKPLEGNPAETLLRSIDGSNYGRATGHSLFSPSRIERATMDARPRSSSNNRQTGTMYYSRGGSCEDRV